MKRIVLLLTLMLFLSFGMAFAQTGGDISVQVDGLYLGDIAINGDPVTFNVNYHNLDLVNKGKGLTNGYEFSVTGSATWTCAYNREFTFDPSLHFNLVNKWNKFDWDGAGTDTIGYAGTAGSYDPEEDPPGTADGLPPGYNGPALSFEFDFTDVETDAGQTFCLDSCFYPPSGLWKWAFGIYNDFPIWDGPHCYTLVWIPNLPPVWTDDPATDVNPDHSTTASIDYEAMDQDDPPELVSFTKVSCSGAGSNGITVQYPGDGVLGGARGTCTFDYAPVFPTDVVTDVTVVLDVTDGVNTAVPSDGTVISFGNAAPSFTFGCGEYVEFGKGGTGEIQFTGTDGEDTWHFVLDDVTPVDPVPPEGNVSIDGAGKVTFASGPGDAPGANTLYTIKVWVSDGLDSVSCTAQFMVLFTEAYGVEIGGSVRGIVGPVIQGTHVTVPVTLNLGSEYLRGFDILIAYDASALIFTAAAKGALYAPPFGICDPAWEYFNYSYNWNGNCGNQCPSGYLHVVGIGETNDGPVSPDFACLDGLAKPYTLFNLDFLVTNDRTFECQFVPISFYWMDCGDNSLAYDPVAPPDNEAVQGVSRYVFTWNGTKIGDANPLSLDYGLGMYTGFPTYTGIQYDPCMVPDPLYPTKPLPVPWVDFINGGIEIYCADEIDDRGDINMNGVANEIADAVLFSNYFIHGLSVFDVGALAPAGQVAATDVNADGLTLSVADLVYLIRIIVGDALPYPKLGTVAAAYTLHNGVMSVDSKMGAAYVVVEGNVAPILLADNMEMMYNFDGANTRILVSKIEKGAAFEGDFLQVDGSVITAEFATYEGAPVASVAVPVTAQLYQNYPNPFNPMTTISFGLPTAGEYTLTIYNVTGQTVTTFSDNAEAGKVMFEWDASDMASGIYFYKLDANNFTDTKKMVLLK